MSNYDSTETTMVPGTLRGYRVWRLTPYGLGSVSFASYVWKRNEQARCAHGQYTLIKGDLVETHSAPVSGCTCGLYAKHTLQDVEYEFDGGGYMFGSIKAHGRIILGDRGFKAERAEIEALLWRGPPIRYVDPDGALATALNSVPFYTDRAQFLKDYPPIPVDHLLPEKAPNPWLADPGAPLNLDALQLYLDQKQLERDQENAYMVYRMTRKMMGY